MAGRRRRLAALRLLLLRLRDGGSLSWGEVGKQSTHNHNLETAGARWSASKPRIKKVSSQ